MTSSSTEWDSPSCSCQASLGGEEGGHAQLPRLIQLIKYANLLTLNLKFTRVPNVDMLDTYVLTTADTDLHCFIKYLHTSVC